MTTINTLTDIKQKEPITLDSMATEEFDSIMENGLTQAKADQSHQVAHVFANLRKGLE